MTLAQSPVITIPGISFLGEAARPEEVFTPEDFSEEHRMIAEMTEKFVQQEVLPVAARIEEKEDGLTASLLKKAGELGLLSIEIPEAYGGLALDTVSALIVCEKTGHQPSFGTSFGAHSGIGTLPIVYFGTDDQRQRYITRISQGESLAAFALTEASSGSDALAAHTRATLTPDGKAYMLNGQKMWITNAGFADVFVVFAKIDGSRFTAFIVERGMPGFTIGTEEKKMGLQGSSTCLLNLEDVRVPVENVLGGVGRGPRVAMDVLNVGRLKLGGSCVGASKICIDEALGHCLSRQLFKKTLGEFGAIKHKIAEMAIRTWVAEGVAYRTASLLSNAVHACDLNDTPAIETALEEYAAECALVKLVCSEHLDYVTDEAVQIFGGYGYSREYLVERQYRDSRINRIFEGTNEINRLAVSGAILKKALRGKSTLLDQMAVIRAEMEAADAAEAAGQPIAAGFAPSEGLLGHERDLLTKARRLLQYAVDVAVDAFKKEIVAEQQEVQFHLADAAGDIYMMETALVRVEKALASKTAEQLAPRVDMVKVFANDAFERVVTNARHVIAASREGDALGRSLRHVERLGAFVPINTIIPRRRIAAHLLEAGRYEL